MRLNEIARESKSTFKGDKTDLPIVGLEHLIPGELTLTEYDVNTKNTFTKFFRKGQVLFGRRRAYLKKASLAEFDGVCSGDIIVIEPIEGKVYPDLLPFIIQNDRFFAYAVSKSAGGLSPRVKWQDIADYELSLPSLSAQRELSKKLWAAYRLKESYKKLLLATRDMVKSQFIEMFYGKDYPEAMIKSFADITTGSTPSKSHPEFWGGNNPWVSAEDMKDKNVYDTSEKLTDIGYAKCKPIPVNTLMYVCRGSIGVMAINKIECATNQSICRATCKEGVCNVEYLYHALMYQKDTIKKIGTGTSFKSLNQTTFSELKIILPPYSAQMQFVSIADQADKSEFELKKSIEAIDAVIKSLINN